MKPDLRDALRSSRYPSDRVEAALGDAKESFRVLSAVRAEDEARFREAAVAFLRAEASPRIPTLSPLARNAFEGLGGVLEERACDHLATSDVSRLARAIPDCTNEDLVDLFLTIELGEAEATARLGARLASIPLPALPDELSSDAVGAARLYRALRTRFAGPDEELEYLNAQNGTRLVAAGAGVLAEALGRPWPEVVPSHNRGATNASRALSWAVAALGDEALSRWLKAILSHARVKGRLACDGLPWDARFDGAGGGHAARVFRYRTTVVTEEGKAHPEITALPNRPKRSVKVHARLDKAEADFDERVQQLTAKHGLSPLDPASLGPALERTCMALPSDYAVALVSVGAPLPALARFRGDPEVTRLAILAGADPTADEAALAQLGPFYWDVQRAEVLVAHGARSSSPGRLTEAAKNGELAMARLLLRAGAPIEPAALEHATRWPRLNRLLSEGSRDAP